jgi:hypothetical protein
MGWVTRGVPRRDARGVVVVVVVAVGVCVLMCVLMWWVLVVGFGRIGVPTRTGADNVRVSVWRHRDPCGARGY